MVALEVLISTRHSFVPSKNAHALYTEELAEKRRQEQATIEGARKNQEKEKNLAEIREIENDLLLIKSRIEIAEKSIQD